MSLMKTCWKSAREDAQAAQEGWIADERGWTYGEITSVKKEGEWCNVFYPIALSIICTSKCLYKFNSTNVECIDHLFGLCKSNTSCQCQILTHTHTHATWMNG